MIALMAAEGLAVKPSCQLLEVTRAGYYAAVSRPPSARAIRHAWLTDLIAEIHAASHGTYGGPRVHAELRLGRGGGGRPQGSRRPGIGRSPLAGRKARVMLGVGTPAAPGIANAFARGCGRPGRPARSRTTGRSLPPGPRPAMWAGTGRARHPQPGRPSTQ